jgi:putative endonuclease
MNRVSAGAQAHSFGLAAEAIAARHYLSRSADMLGQRARNKGGEIDLIVRDGKQIVFVEVKARRSLAEAAWSISPRQVARIGNAAQLWLNDNGHADQDFRFDVILVDRCGNTEVLENALSFDT